MSTDASNCTTGVYLITNTVNGAVYVGSTSTSFRTRWWHHRHLLERGKHDNRHLQHAWNKYGEGNFTFTVAEYVSDLGVLIEREQAWIDRYYALGRKKCYNLTPTAGSNRGYKQPAESIRRSVEARRGRVISEETRRRISEGGKRRAPISEETREKLSKAGRGRKMPVSVVAARMKTCEGFVSPDGVVYSPVTNIAGFAREHGLHTGSMNMLSRGKLLSVKGWTRLGAEERQVYAFRSPDGKVYENIKNLTAFADRHGLERSLLGAVFRGRRAHHKGWARLDTPTRRAYVFIAPDGKRWDRITNLAAFCKNFGLNAGAMSQVYLGNCRHHKGWTKG